MSAVRSVAKLLLFESINLGAVYDESIHGCKRYRKPVDLPEQLRGKSSANRIPEVKAKILGQSFNNATGLMSTA